MGELKIIYSDSDIAVVIKPRGIESEHGLPKLISSMIGSEVYPVHRLDKEASGLMVYALNTRSAAELTRQISLGGFEKYYYAVLIGEPENDRGVFSDYLYHDRQKNKTYVVSKQRKGVKLARLEYEVLEKVEENSRILSLVKVHLFTGRTHQIRVQFASRRLPLLGDTKYGGKKEGVSTALFSCKIEFKHPVSGEIMSFSEKPRNEYPWDLFGRWTIP